MGVGLLMNHINGNAVLAIHFSERAILPATYKRILFQLKQKVNLQNLTPQLISPLPVYKRW